MTAPGRREQNKAETRARIITAAIELMAREGYAQTSTTAIARAARVAPSTLFNHFPTKAAILFADTHLWAPPASISAGATPQHTLLAMLQGMLASPGWVRGVDDPLTAARFQLVRESPELRDIQTATAMAQVPVFANRLRELHPDIDPATCLALSGAMVGAVISAVTHGDAADLPGAILGAASIALQM